MTGTVGEPRGAPHLSSLPHGRAGYEIPAGDCGAVAIWAIGLAMLGFVGCGVIVDVGGALVAKVETYDVAQQAARAGADHLDLAVLRRDGQIRLDPLAARVAAQDFLSADRVQGTATATPEQVQVIATTDHRTQFLTVVGLGSLTVTATAYAEPIATP
jgi:Flp pilus assembly protein TadG